jgi:hypothetical protein
MRTQRSIPYDVHLRNGRLLVTPLRTAVPPEAEELGRRAYDEQPRLARELQHLPTEVWTAPSRCAGE